ncbi:MAG: hypothetical protein HY360_24065, partial [Verrucomicrobia bacterium]|nr:hypothetical protein [Verrucomicrobiota bacterium]
VVTERLPQQFGYDLPDELLLGPGELFRSGVQFGFKIKSRFHAIMIAHLPQPGNPPVMRGNAVRFVLR